MSLTSPLPPRPCSVNELALCLRETLSERLLAAYTHGNTFYRINQQSTAGTGARAGAGAGAGIEAEGTLQTPQAQAHAQAHAWDQVLTHDVEEFTYALAGLFSHVLKPTVDVLHFSYEVRYAGAVCVCVCACVCVCTHPL